MALRDASLCSPMLIPLDTYHIVLNLLVSPLNHNVRAGVMFSLWLNIPKLTTVICPQ